MSTSATFDTSEPAAMAMFLGLPRPKTYTGLMLADAIKLGVPLSSVERVCKRIDPDGHRLSVTDIMAKATYHRRVKDEKPLSRDDSEKLWQIGKVYLLAHALYGDENDARAFLFRPHPLLNQRLPVDLAMESAVGAELVANLLIAADAGVAV